MTLEQSTLCILTAAEAQDLEALRAAAALRDAALAELHSFSPTPALCAAITESLAAGEKARQALQAIKRRIGNESRRLARIESGFVSASRPVEMHRVDCRG